MKQSRKRCRRETQTNVKLGLDPSKSPPLRRVSKQLKINKHFFNDLIKDLASPSTNRFNLLKSLTDQNAATQLTTCSTQSPEVSQEAAVGEETFQSQSLPKPDSPPDDNEACGYIPKEELIRLIGEHCLLMAETVT